MAAKKKAAKKRAATKRAPRAAKKAAKKGRGRSGMRPFEATETHRWQVERLVAYGFTQKEIAQLILNPRTGKPISDKTLQKHFAAELERGGKKIHAMIADSLVKKAIGDHPKSYICAMFILKCRFGWRETSGLVHETDGISTGVLVAPASVTPEDWIRAQERKNGERSEPKDEE